MLLLLLFLLLLEATTKYIISSWCLKFGHTETPYVYIISSTKYITLTKKNKEVIAIK